MTRRNRNSSKYLGRITAADLGRAAERTLTPDIETAAAELADWAAHNIGH